MKKQTEQPTSAGPATLLKGLLPILAILLLLPVPAVLAQEDAETAEEEPQLLEQSEVITVTARKREENLQEVPVAVTVVEGDSLEDLAALDIAEIQANVPNLSIYPGRNQSTTLTVFMRGVGQADPLWGVDPGVGLYLDDVYLARPQGALLDVFDVERIEVLRGPQGTLYGKNTIGGAIKYVSRRPTDEFEGRIAFTGGSFSAQEVRAGFSGPLVEGKLRGKFSIASLQHDGYGDNLFTGEEVSDKDTLAFRFALDWLPSDDVTVRFAYDQTEDDAQPKGYTRLAANPFCPLFLGAACPPLDTFDVEAGLAQINGTDSEGYSMTIEWDINDDWRFKSITAHRESDSRNNIDFDTTPAPITDVVATYFDDQDSQEFQFIYDGGGDLNGVFGFYYFDGRAGGLVQNVFFGSIFGTTDGDTDTDSLAIFGDGSYAINDKLTFNFGARFTEEDKNGRAFNAGYTDGTFTEVAVVTADYDETTTFSSFSPKLGLDYQLSEDVMGYVSLSRGFKSGGYNVRAQAAAFPDTSKPFEDEKLTVAEVGIKSYVNDSLVLNAAVFTGDYEDVQVSTFTSFDSDGDGQNDSFFGNFLNAGEATLSGVELEWDYRSPTATWFGLSGNLSYLDADADLLDENQDGVLDTQVITNAPEITGALNLNFNTEAWNGLVSGFVGYAYRDDSTLTNEANPIVQESFGLLNAQVGWLSEDGSWSITLNGKNLTDEEYLTNGYNIPVLGILTGSFGTPMTVTATVGYNF